MSHARRYTTVGLERRHARGPHNALGASSAYQAILGANMLLEFHSQLGIALVGGAVDTWTDQVSGVVVQAPGASQRPVYAPDGTAFGSKSVVQSATTNNLFLQTLTMPATLFPASTRPYVFARLRYNGPLNDTRNWYELSSATANELLAYNLNNDFEVFAGGANRNTGQIPNLTANVIQSTSMWADGTNMNVQVNANAIHAVAYAGSTATACTRVGIGNAAFGGGLNSANLSIALWIACAAYPGATAEAALRAQAATEFPP